MKSLKFKYFLLTISFALFIGCSGENMLEKFEYTPLTKNISDSDWDKLALKKIYFGHHSVGFNIMDGINDLMKENSKIKLRLLQTDDPTQFQNGIFAHSTVGHNLDPNSKINDFSIFMDKGLGEKCDISFFKFCFVDFDTASDIDKIFNDYKKTMAELKRKYPKTKFVNVSVPLTTKPNVKANLKSFIKGIVGKADIYNNRIKYKINQMLRNEYEGREPFFDLAKIESTYPDGTRFFENNDGKDIEALINGYALDNGHLNERGRKWVAENLLVFLTNL